MQMELNLANELLRRSRLCICVRPDLVRILAATEIPSERSKGCNRSGLRATLLREEGVAGLHRRLDRDSSPRSPKPTKSWD